MTSKKDESHPAEERVLVLAPTPRDASLSQNILTSAGIDSHVFFDLRELCAEAAKGAGALLLTEVALASSEMGYLLDLVKRQPGWADLPILLLAEHGADSPLAITAMELLGNVTVLEQPVRVTTLISTLRTALKSRRRQYELRDQMESRMLLAGIVESSEDAIISKTLDGIITSWNAGAERLFGYTAKEAIGQPITLIIPLERLAEEQFIINRLRRGARIEHFETVRLSKSGDYLDISLMISPLRDHTGRVIGASKIARDITDRKRAEEALRESEQRFRFLAETIPSFVWTAAPDGRVTYTNRRWLEYCGLTPEQSEGNWSELVLHPDDYERCMLAWAEALRDGKEYEMELRNRRYDGVYRWFVTRAAPLRDGTGRIVSWFGVTTDIHDQKELEEQLREADRRKDEFLATLAHELRNPLAPIRNSLQFLRLTSGGQVNGDHAAEIIERQVNQLVRLVDDLLEVSRITRGKIELRHEPVQLGEIISSAVETSRPLIEAGGHHLEIIMPSEPLVLEADPVRVSQVISNLLNNAAKYMETGGRIWLAARREGRQIVVSVRDTGVGIPAHMLPKVFEMFTQVDRSLGRAQGGLGIGLTLARSLVQLHGGSLEAQSDGAGLGSEFIVRLPLTQAAPAGSELREAAEAHAGNGPVAPLTPESSSPARRILVVDDNVDSAESLAMFLQLMGHEVQLVHEGLAAIERARVYRPEVIVLDIGLPDIDGYEVAGRLRQEPSLNGILLIALTGYGQEEDRQRAHDAGFDEHLVKPVDPSSLEALLSGATRSAEN